MLDTQTLIIVNLIVSGMLAIFMLVSRVTLGAASAGALTWVVGDLLQQIARGLVLVGNGDSGLGWFNWNLSDTLHTAAGALVSAGMWWHMRALRRVDGERLPAHRLVVESLLVGAGWLAMLFLLPDNIWRRHLLGTVIVLGAALTLLPAWHLAKRFWGARVILLTVLLAMAAESLAQMTHGAGAPLAAPDEVARLFLGETVFTTAMTMGFLVLLQEQVRQQLIELSMSDPLTSLYNRRGLLTLLQRDLERARRAEQPLSLAMFDIDHFKRINDSAGHDVGDEVLQGFASRLRASFRRGDLIGRWGGEEFVVVMPGVALQQAAALADRCRLSLHGSALAPRVPTHPVTVSAGVAEADWEMDVPQAATRMLADADRRMYAAKLTRDSVCVAN